MRIIGEGLKANTTLTSLDIYDKTKQLMFNHKQNNTTLGNVIGPDGAKCISEGLKANSGLRALDIGCKSSK